MLSCFLQGSMVRPPNTLPGFIYSAVSPQVCPAVSLKLVLYFTLNAAGSQNSAHCSLLFLALRFLHLPTKICSPSENGLYFLPVRKPLSHEGCSAIGSHTSGRSSTEQGSALCPSLPLSQPYLSSKWLSCLLAAGSVAPPITVSFLYCLLYARDAKFMGVVARNYRRVRISLL